ncbi:MAG: hypothetical protein D6826_00060 [Alphaproteobacteria bacterium]|nr:MAG: hypothetical protein D6826_00060 [Alphaproteobacteria bacterium]
MKCPACETHNDVSHRYCVHCGARLDRACPSCHAPIVADASYCPRCGAGMSPAPHGHDASAGTPTRERSLTTERKHVSILFADLCNSLTLIDSDPEDAKHLLEGVLDAMSCAVRDHGGIVTQSMGDGIMALFGAPHALEDHALRACLAAKAMQDGIRAHARSAQTGIAIRTGICSGEVVVGTRGQGFDQQYTAFGRTAHLAARMEQMARPGKILIAEPTAGLVRRHVTLRPLGSTAVRGLAEPLCIYELESIDYAINAAARNAPTVPFVERESELAVFDHALRDAAAGRGRVIAVVGEPGIGKTRLVTHFITTRTRGDWLVLHSSGMSHLTPPPFGAVGDVLAGCFAVAQSQEAEPLSDRVARRLASLGVDCAKHLPALMSIFGLDPEGLWSDLPPEQKRRRIRQAVLDVLLAQSQEQPVLIWIDDLQWIDADSLEILSLVASSLTNLRLLLLIAHRSGYRHGWDENPNYIRTPLHSLRPDEAAAFLDRLVGTNAQLVGLRRELLHRTNGNPFFLEELVRDMVASGALEGTQGYYRMTERLREIPVPPTVQDVIAMRIDRLSAMDKRLLQSAAAIGYKVDRAVLANLVDLREEDLAAQIQTLESAEFLHVEIENGESVLVFNHALVHDVAYNSLLHREHKALHGRIVQTIERLHAHRLDECTEMLAFHAARAENWQLAVTCFRESGRQALWRSACRQAVEALERGLELVERLPPGDEATRIALDIRLDLRNALMPLGRHREILPHLQHAESLGRRCHDKRRLAQSCSYMAHYHWLMGNWESSIEVGELALRTAADLNDFGLCVVARFILGLAAYSVGDFPAAVRYLGQNREVLVEQRSGQRFGMFALPSVVSRGWMAWCQAELGQFEEALLPAREAKEIAASIGRPFDNVQANLGLGGVLLMKGHVNETIDLLETALCVCEEAEVHILLPRVAAALGYAFALDGQMGRALTLAQRALHEADDMRLAPMRTLCLRWICEVKLLSGHAEDSLAAAEEMLVECRKSGEKAHVAWAQYFKGASLANRAGESDLRPALATLEQAERLARRLGMRPLLAHVVRRRGELLSATGLAGTGESVLATARALYRELGMDSWLDRTGRDRARPG